MGIRVGRRRVSRGVGGRWVGRGVGGKVGAGGGRGHHSWENVSSLNVFLRHLYFKNLNAIKKKCENFEKYLVDKTHRVI